MGGRLAWLAAAIALAACAPAPRKGEAAQCALNSECAAPLVCRLGACRNECNSARDCTPGLACVRDENMLGVCQLDQEKHCAVDSACPAPLVCRAMQCVNVCATDRDCPPGASCVDVAGGRGCIDPSTGTACVRDSECAGADGGGEHLVCANDGRCRPECETDRDCRDGTVCDWRRDHACRAPGSIVDAGPIDAGGTMDASTDGGVTDGAPDGGATVDGGCTSSSTATAVAVGNEFACAIVEGGQVACWGFGAHGVLGPSVPVADSLVPVLVVGITDAVAIRAEESDVCVLRAGGGVLCWGADDYGQLGDGTVVASTGVPTPTAPTGLAAARGIAVGVWDVCAIDTSGGVSCWGENDNGSLGDGTTGTHPNATMPTPVPGLPGPADEIAAFTLGACALSMGSVTCWGQNESGEAGSGSAGTPVPSPTHAVTTIADATHLCASDDGVCVLRAGGVVSCWGGNSHGELGDGTGALHASTTMPSIVTGLTARAIACGLGFDCAITGSGTVQCWGWDLQGQLGDGLTAERHTAGVDVVGLPVGIPVTDLAAGGDSACAVSRGDVYCWGANARGELGNGSVDPPFSVVAHSTPSRVVCLP